VTRRPGRSPLVVDPLLDRLAYRCPSGCPAGRTCCVGLVVEVSRREMRVVDSLMDELARLVPALHEADGFANVFVDEPPAVLIEPRDDRGTCPFLFRRGGRALCAIHHLALRTGRDVASVKPAACRHWPLVLEPAGRRVRVTVHPSATRIGCVAPRRSLPGHPTVREAFARELRELARLAAR
jgi:hypothetical protein